MVEKNGTIARDPVCMPIINSWYSAIGNDMGPYAGGVATSLKLIGRRIINSEYLISTLILLLFPQRELIQVNTFSLLYFLHNLTYILRILTEFNAIMPISH